jgi:hypothetical protein
LRELIQIFSKLIVDNNYRFEIEYFFEVTRSDLVVIWRKALKDLEAIRRKVYIENSKEELELDGYKIVSSKLITYQFHTNRYRWLPKIQPASII